MNDLKAKRTAPDLPETSQPGAARERVLLRAGEVEEPQGERAGAIADAAQELPPPPVRNLGELDLTFDDGAHAMANDADLGNLRAILVSRRQDEQQVLHLGHTELGEFFSERGSDAPQ